MSYLDKLKKLKYNQTLAFGDEVYLASEVEALVEKMEERIEYLAKAACHYARKEAEELGLNPEVAVVPYLLPPMPKELAALYSDRLKEKEFNAVKGQVFEVIDCRIEDLKREKQQLIEALDTQKKLNASLEAENARLRAEIEDCRYGDDCGGLGLFHGD